MLWSSGRHALRAAARCVCRPAAPIVAVCAIALGGCNVHDRESYASAAQPRGPTVAFESIDGPPRAQFQKLVQNLNDEAQNRRLAVISREQTSAYRVRGYLAAEAAKGKAANTTTISWVWDVFDGNDRRTLRIEGAEAVKGRHRNAWQAADDALLRRIVQGSMDRLAAFLTSPEAAAGAPKAGTPVDNLQTAVADLQTPAAGLPAAAPPAFSPEAAGIFRIFRPHADPAPSGDGASQHAAQAGDPDDVPLPPQRPEPTAAVSAHGMVTLAASRR